MKKVIYIIGVVLLTMASIGCTDYNLVDTGEANGNHQTIMWEYFKGDSYNWDSLVVMADYAGLKPIFDGTSKYGKQITFFGITNHSIRRYLLQNSYKRVKDIPKEDCRRMILNCVLNQRIMLDEFTPGRPSGSPDRVIGTGGKIYEMLSGKKLWIYSFRISYNGVPEAGPLNIFLVSPDSKKSTRVASSNIQTLTGVVHSLDYNFTLNDF